MKRKKNIAVVHCSGGAKQNEGIDFAALPKDCNQILEQYPDGIHSCSYGCLGGGSCVAACKLHALTINEKGVAEVDPSKRPMRIQLVMIRPTYTESSTLTS